MENNLFFDLIRVTLDNAVCLSRTPNVNEWSELYAIAKKQSLVGVCFAGVQKLQIQQQTPPEMLYLQWMGMAAKIQQRNEVVNQQCIDLQKRLSAEGYRSCILKGQGAGVNYGTIATLRQSGDIDIWIEGDRERVIELVQSLAPTREIRETHAQLRIFKDTEVEAHYRPGLLRNFVTNRRLQSFFAEHANACFENKMPLGDCGIITVPAWEFNVVYMLSHMHHHLFAGGVGLRQVMDYYFLLKSHQADNEQKARAMKVITDCGMKRYAGAMMWILRSVFGLDERFMICNANEKDGKFLLDEIMMSGNFGHQDERNKKFDSESHLQNFFGTIIRNLHLLRFAPFDWLMSPLWRIYYFGWRKINGYE